MEIARKTDVGIERKQNQDQVGIFYNENQLPILLLCDGMGGHNAGDVASEMAIFAIGHAWENTEDIDSPDKVTAWMQENIQTANAKIYENANKYQDLAGMGTTIVAAVVFEELETAVLAHVGDSRIYLIQEEIMNQATKDHSYVQELVDMQMITEEEASHHPQKNILTRAVGIDPEVEVEIEQVTFLSGDMLLLCSDGLTDMVDESQALAILTDAHKTVEEKTEALVDQANANGGRDNISVLIAQREKEENDNQNEGRDFS